MSCRCQCHFQMPQVRVAPSLWANGATELLLDTSKQTNKSNEATTKCPMPGPAGREIMPNSRGGTQPPVCESLRHPSFPHCEFSWREVAGARGSVSEGVGMEAWECVSSGFCFSVSQMLVRVLTFHNHQQEYRPLDLKWVERQGPQAWLGSALLLEEVMQTLL